MTALSVVRRAVASQIGNAIPGLHCYPTMPPNPSLPALGLAVRRVEYRKDFNDLSLFVLTAWVYVNASDLTRAQEAIDAYIDPQSATAIKTALESDPSLGGIAQWAIATGVAEGPRLVDTAGGQPFAVPIDLEILA